LTGPFVVKCMLQRIHYKFCDNQAEAVCTENLVRLIG
jgi:hypothetical protein